MCYHNFGYPYQPCQCFALILAFYVLILALYQDWIKIVNFANIPLAEHKHFVTYLKTQSTASERSSSSPVKLAYFFSFLNWDWFIFKYFLNIQVRKAHRKLIDFIMLLLSVKDKSYALESTGLSLGSWPSCLAFILSHVLPVSSAAVEQTGSKAFHLAAWVANAIDARGSLSSLMFPPSPSACFLHKTYSLYSCDLKIGHLINIFISA